MQQLTALDVMFSSLDTETTNGMLGALIRFEPPTDGRPHADAAFVRARIGERLPYLPPLHRRVVKVPLGLEHDYLGRADRIDLLKHVRTVRLPFPGMQAQLADEVSRIMSSSLDPDLPPWDYTVIEGLEDGSVAHLLRIHHLVIDGGSMPVLWDALSDKPTQPLVLDPGSEHHEPRWGRPEMLVRELAGLANKPSQLSMLVLHYLQWQLDEVKKHGLLAPVAMPMRLLLPGPFAAPAKRLLNERLRAAGIAPIEPFLPVLDPPSTPFNGRVGSERTFAFDDLSLADFREAGKALGGTINDVVLGVSAGALRRYLRSRGIPADKPLIVSVPVTIRGKDETLQWANFVSMIFTELPTHLDDPVARVRAAKASVRAAKGSFDAMPTTLLREASQFIPAAMFNTAMRLMVKLPDKVSKGPNNVVISNVKGPVEPIVLDGVKIKGYWPASFLSVGGGINITLQSYTDRVCFGFMGNPQQVGDIAPLVDFMRESLAETMEAAAKVREREAARGTGVPAASRGSKPPRRLAAVPRPATGT